MPENPALSPSAACHDPNGRGEYSRKPLALAMGLLTEFKQRLEERSRQLREEIRQELLKYDGQVPTDKSVGL